VEEITVLAKLQVKDGMEAKERQAFLACIESTRSEISCIKYDLHLAPNNKRIFMMYDNKASKKTWEEHLQMPYLESLLGLSAELFSEPIDIILWEMTSEK